MSVAPPEYPFPLYQAPPPPSRSPKSREGIGAPSLALWVGARAGWDFPLGSAFRDRIGAVRPESSFVSSGPVLQIDLGARIARRLVPFAFAARTFASGGAASTIPSATPRQGLPNEPPQGIVSEVASASSTLVGLGMRYLFSPDDWGAAVEISYAYRLTRAEFRDGTVYRADAPGLLRLGAGLEVRVSRIVSVSPMLVASVGSYSDVTTQRPDGPERSVVAEVLTHGYVGLVLGGGFDLFSRWD